MTLLLRNCSLVTEPVVRNQLRPGHGTFLTSDPLFHSQSGGCGGAVCPFNPLRMGLQGTSVLVPINQSVRFFSLPLPLANLLSPAALTGVACLQNKLRASLLSCCFAPLAPELSSLPVARGLSASPHSCVRTYDPCTWSWICSFQLLCAWFPNSAALLNNLGPCGKKLVESFGRGIGIDGEGT